ncbi:Uncharacterised protein [Mycobacteroides abscessus subsp. massiliense]|nr:Uncharacterised protein [Mycobacteroides abscessus subsp. massiliense]
MDCSCAPLPLNTRMVPVGVPSTSKITPLPSEVRIVQSGAGSGCGFPGWAATVSQAGSAANRPAFWSAGGGACLALAMVVAIS